jgi:hypothetical protein
MHGPQNITFISAQQAKQIYRYKNIKEKLYKDQNSNMVQQNKQTQTANTWLYIYQFHSDPASSQLA